MCVERGGSADTSWQDVITASGGCGHRQDAHHGVSFRCEYAISEKKLYFFMSKAY